MNCWYWNVSSRKPKPSKEDLKKVSVYYTVIYQKEGPSLPGLPLTIHISPFPINDKAPTKVEVQEAVCRLMIRKAGEHTHLCSEHLKGWLSVAYPDRDTTSPNPDFWEKLVTLVQHML